MGNEKKKLAFVDLAVHEFTKSTEFLIDLFSEHFDVVNIWYDYGNKEKHCIEEIKKYDNIFLLQILLPYNVLIQLQKSGKKIIWAPMYDGLPMSYYYWDKIASTGIKILSFTEGIENVCNKHNIDFVSVRYYKKPVNEIKDFQKNKYVIFFWYRGSVKFTEWISLFPTEMVEKIYYYSAPLGSHFINEEIAEEAIKKNKIEKIELQEFSVNRNIFLEYLEKADVFVCPRKQDGIGNPLIEAISFGKFVVGYDDYAMKDYIKHNKNGFLFSAKEKEKISAITIKNSMNYRIKYAIDGYENWKLDEVKIKELFNSFTFKNIQTPGLKIYLIMVYEFLKKVLKRILGKK